MQITCNEVITLWSPLNIELMRHFLAVKAKSVYCTFILQSNQNKYQ